MTNSLITGLPTFMAIYPARLEAEGVLAALRAMGYPIADVSVYHRLKGTDQVIDATTGQIASGQALTEEEITPKMLDSLETAVLLHPQEAHLQAVQDALLSFGESNILYEGSTQGKPEPDETPAGSAE